MSSWSRFFLRWSCSENQGVLQPGQSLTRNLSVAVKGHANTTLHFLHRNSISSSSFTVMYTRSSAVISKRVLSLRKEKSNQSYFVFFSTKLRISPTSLFMSASHSRARGSRRWLLNSLRMANSVNKTRMATTIRASNIITSPRPNAHGTSRSTR